MRVVNYGPGECLAWLHRRGRQVVRTRIGRQRYAYLLGPGANAFIFANDGLFRVREAFSALIPIDGPTSLVVSDGPDHTRRRAVMRPGLSPRRVEGYLALMAAIADEALAGVRAGEPFDAYALFRAAIRRSTMRALFGEQIAGHAQEVGERLQPLLALADHLPDVIDWHRRLRTPQWRRAMRARSLLDEFVYAEIARAASGPAGVDGDTVLATLVGSGLSNLEIRDQMVTMIAAGYETTSAAMGWTLYALGGHPELLRAAREEVLEVTGGAPPTRTDLPRLRLLGAIVTESLRLYPPAVISARYVAEAFEFAGRQISPGTMVIFSPYATHRDPGIYEAPREFRPQRWLEDGVRPGPGEYVPFGGGVHRCIGSTMATTEITVMLARLLARSTYTLTEQRVRAKGYAAMRPRDGLWLTVPSAQFAAA